MQYLQNSIALYTFVSLREFAYLITGDNTVILPGTLGGVKEAKYGIVLESDPSNLTSFEPAIILENFYNNTGLHANQPRNIDHAYIIIRRLFCGDIYLMRAVEGNYRVGDPVFATRTDNGIYVSLDGEGCFIGFVKEDYDVIPEMMNIVDNGKTNVNNKLVNLVKIRVGTRWEVLSQV